MADCLAITPYTGGIPNTGQSDAQNIQDCTTYSQWLVDNFVPDVNNSSQVICEIVDALNGTYPVDDVIINNLILRVNKLKQELYSLGLVADDLAIYNGVQDTDHIVSIPAKGKYIVGLTLTRNKKNFPNDNKADVGLRAEDASGGNLTIVGLGSYVDSYNTIDVVRSGSTMYIENTTSTAQDVNIRLRVSNSVNPTPTPLFGGSIEYRIVKTGVVA